jgi:hypothetical protein
MSINDSTATEILSELDSDIWAIGSGTLKEKVRKICYKYAMLLDERDKLKSKLSKIQLIIGEAK